MIIFIWNKNGVDVNLHEGIARLIARLVKEMEAQFGVLSSNPRANNFFFASSQDDSKSVSSQSLTMKPFYSLNPLEGKSFNYPEALSGRDVGFLKVGDSTF